MWLPKNERKLLGYYHSKLKNEHNDLLDLNYEVLIASMKILESSTESISDKDAELDIMESCSYEKVKYAQKHLQDRELLQLDYSWTGHTQDSCGGVIYKMKRVNLTTEGYDLARKYSRWFPRWGLWWQEHKVNPLWIVIGFIITYVAGICSAVLIDKLTSP